MAAGINQQESNPYNNAYSFQDLGVLLVQTFLEQSGSGNPDDDEQLLQTVLQEPKQAKEELQHSMRVHICSPRSYTKIPRSKTSQTAG